MERIMKSSFLPERILLIFLSIISVVKCIDEYQFLLNNRCGCFLEPPLCHETTELVPQHRDLVFVAFPTVRDCSKMFLDGYNISKTDEINGNIRLSLLLNPLRPVKELNFRVALKVAVDGSTDMAIQQERSYNVSFNTKSVLHIDFSYLYSGTYQLELLDTVKCQTNNFIISSSYQQEKLNELEPYFHSKFTSESQIIVSFSHGALDLAKKVEIMLYSEDFLSHSRKKLETVVLSMQGSNGTCCSNIKMDGIEEDDHGLTEESKNLTCPCFWDGSKLKCLFMNASEGLYYAEIHIIDRRCGINTVWTKENEGCSWFYNINATRNGYPSVFKMALSTQNKESHYWLYSLPILGMFIIACAAIFLWKKMSYEQFKERKESSGPIRRFFLGATVKFCTILYISRPKLFEDLDNARKKYAFLNLNNESNSLDSCLVINGFGKSVVPEILMLYPRDCEALMRTMVTLRKTLESCNFLVHDPWDEENYENIMESFETWTISFINNHYAKIIIVLNECSKAFERAFLDNSVLEYHEPQVLDSIFRLSLSSIHLYFAERFDSYQRLFVVRFEESTSENFNFITPATVYTLPVNISLLIKDLGGYPRNLNPELLEELKSSTAEYNYFMKTNSDYLNDLLLKNKT